MGLIALEGMRFYARHGYYEYERISGNLFMVDLYVQADTRKGNKNDRLEDTLNYEKLYETVSNEMKREPVKLLEHLAHRILEQLGRNFKALGYAKIRISKMNPPIPGDVERVYIEQERKYRPKRGGQKAKK